MADETTNPVVTTPDAPAAAPVAPAAPAAAPMVPSAPAASATDPRLAQETNAAIDARQNAAKIASESTAPPPPGPHAKLAAMVSGLMLGLDSFGKSIATGGREGGVQEVVQVQGEQQRQKLEAQQARDTSKNQRLQQQIMIAQAHEANFQNILNLQTLPDDIASHHLAVTGATQQQAITGAEFQATHGGMKPDEFSSALSDDPMGGQRSAASGWFTNNAVTTLDAGKKALGESDPAVQALQKVLDKPDVSSKELYAATVNLENRRAKLAAATKEKSEANVAESNSPVAKLSTPEALAAPGAQAAIQAKIADPNTSPEDVTRLRMLLPQAAVAQFNAEQIKQRESRNQQIVNQGDSDTAGKLLANRSLTLQELKSRNVTPAFIQAAVLSAQKYDPQFKAAESDAQAKNAATPSNVQFFGNVDSLLIKGGTLDQLTDAYKALGNTKIPAINTLDNLRKAAFGSGPLAAAYAAQLGVADDYSKVMTGGVGSDTSREQAMQIINANLSPDGRDSAVGQVRKSVTSQRNGRIGTNPYLKDMFPDPTTRMETPGLAGTQPAPPASAASKLHTNLTDFTHHFQGKNGTIYSDDGQTWYDGKGNLVK